MLGLAVVFIYLIMVAQFQSLLSPFIVMFTLPLAFTGGFLGLIIAGQEVSIIAMEMCIRDRNVQAEPWNLALIPIRERQR